MQLSNNGLNLIKQSEECELKAYLDSAGIRTIGWGIIVYPNGQHVKEGDVITQQQADQYLTYQVNLKTSELNPMLKSTINQNQYDALVDFCYNVGTGGFAGSTLRRLVNTNPSDPAIKVAFEMWDKEHVDGELIVSKGLLARRKKEAQLYFS